MKKSVVLGVGLVLSMGLSFTSYAGEWKQDEIGYWWQNEDGSYPSNSWQWLDGDNDGKEECYYFDERGYMLSNTVTPDNYQVNENGAWTVDGVIQQRDTASSVEKNAVSDKFVDITTFFNTDLQYFYKAKEILGEKEWWYDDDTSLFFRGNLEGKYFEISGKMVIFADGTYTVPHDDFEIYYDAKKDDHPIVKIVADPYVLINGLEKDKRYSVSEIVQIARDAGAKNIQTVNNDKVERSIMLEGVENGSKTWTRHSDTVTFSINGLKYSYLVEDANLGSHEFIVTKE